MGRSFFHNNRLYFDDKMKRYFIILLMSMVSFAVPAQNNQKIVDHINQVAHSLKSMQADFVQTKGNKGWFNGEFTLTLKQILKKKQ